MLPSPELVHIITAHATSSNVIDGFTITGSKAIATLYKDRLGIAKNKITYKRALKYGAKDFVEVLSQELQTVLLNSPRVIEYSAYSFLRVNETLDWNSYKVRDALRMIYKDSDLRKEFGLKFNLTDEEEALLAIYNNSDILPTDLKNTINAYINKIPLAPENQNVVKALLNNELLNMLDIRLVKKGLLGPNRQKYLDIYLKILKG